VSRSGHGRHYPASAYPPVPLRPFPCSVLPNRGAWGFVRLLLARGAASFDRQASFVLDRQIEQPLLGEGVSFVCQLTDQFARSLLKTSALGLPNNPIIVPVRIIC
jgi:hypothetical protein